MIWKKKWMIPVVLSILILVMNFQPVPVSAVVGQDMFEINDDFSSAYSLGPGSYFLSIHTAVDEDYFNITLGINQSICLFLWNVSCAVDVSIYDPNSQYLASFYATESYNGSYVLNPTMDGEYTIRVFTYSSDVTYYNLDIIADDYYEENTYIINDYFFFYFNGLWI